MRRCTCEVQFLDGSVSAAELVLVLEVGEHGALQQEEVSLGCAERETSRPHQLAVAGQLQRRALRLGRRGGGGGEGVRMEGEGEGERE